MQINVKVDTARFEARFRNPEKKVRFAVGKAGNRTLVRMQKDGFSHIRSRVIVRNSRFLFGTDARPGGAGGRITGRFNAHSGRLWGEILMSPSEQSSQRRTILPELESGGVKRPRTGSKNVAVPLTGRPARPSISAGVPPAFRMQSLGFRAYRGKKLVTNDALRSGRRRKKGISLTGEFGRVSLPEGPQSVQWKGLHRTFITGPTQREPHGAVWQRIGPDRGDIREIYSFEHEPPIPDVLDWERAVSANATRYFDEEMEHEFFDAFTHEAARGRLL